MAAQKKLYTVYFEGAYYSTVWATCASAAIEKVKPTDWNAAGFTAEEQS